MVSPPMRRGRSPRRCAGRGWVSICRPGRPRTWGCGRLMRCASGVWAVKARRGASRPNAGCMRWRPRDGCGALRPMTDEAGGLVGLRWGAGLVMPIAAPAQSGRGGTGRRAELAEIEGLIAAGTVFSARIVRTLIDGRGAYRMQLVCAGCPTRRHLVGDGQVSFDLGPSRIAVGVQRAGGSWSGWTEPLADAIGLDTMRLRRVQRHLDRRHRGGSLACFSRDGLHTTGRCVWRRCAAGQPTMIGVGELHRRLAEHPKTLHGGLGNRLLGYGSDIAYERVEYVSWQKDFARPQASALADVGGAHQSAAESQNRAATKPLGANLDHRPAHGDSRMNAYRDSPPARGIPAIHCREESRTAHPVSWRATSPYRSKRSVSPRAPRAPRAL